MKAIVIGGGIIGLCSAYYLKKSGWDVTVLDHSDVNTNCSYGNLGMIVPSHFVPLASPGIVAKGFRWMLNSKSPFYVRPSLNRELFSWGWKFIKNANAHNVEKSAAPLLHFNLYSKHLYEELNRQPGFSFAMEQIFFSSPLKMLSMTGDPLALSCSRKASKGPLIGTSM